MLNVRQRRAAEAQQYIIDFIFTHGRGFICQWLDVNLATVKRWEEGKSRVPRAAVIALEAHCGRLPGMQGHWHWEHAKIDVRDGKLYLPHWDRGFTGGEIAGIPYLERAVEGYVKRVKTLEEKVLKLANPGVTSSANDGEAWHHGWAEPDPSITALADVTLSKKVKKRA